MWFKYSYVITDLSFHDFQFACIELTLMTQGIQPMVWHQFEDVDMKEQL
jgi:hypothetical protein